MSDLDSKVSIEDESESDDVGILDHRSSSSSSSFSRHTIKGSKKRSRAVCEYDSEEDEELQEVLRMSAREAKQGNNQRIALVMFSIKSLFVASPLFIFIITALLNSLFYSCS